ncbi:MAG: 5'-nucleotidase C-terminal domain-containing protein [Byssovorax sp.]
MEFPVPPSLPTIALLAALLPACGAAPSAVKTATPAPQAPVHVTLIGLNDLHGAIDAENVTLDNGTTKAEIAVGGLEVMAGYFDAIREDNGINTLFLDAGDAYQGTLLSNSHVGKPVVLAYNALGVHASTFGNHEFDFGALPGDPDKHPQGTTRQIVQLAKFAYLSANVVSKGRDGLFGFYKDPALPIARSAVFCLPGARRATLASPCEPGAVRVGVVGATTEAAAAEAAPVVMQGLDFLPIASTVMAESQRLRESEKVNLVVLLVHEGGKCDMKRPASEGDAACGGGSPPKINGVLDAMASGPLLQQYPHGGVDTVLAGHVHAPQAHFIHGVPVVQTFGFGKAFSRVDLVVDPAAAPTDPREKRVLTTEIDRPTYFCYQHLAHYASCAPTAEQEAYGGYPAGDLGAPVRPTYKGIPITLRSDLSPVLAAMKAEIAALREKVVGSIPKAPLRNDRMAESPMSDCLADALREQARAELGAESDAFVSHSGGIRTSLPGTTVRFGDVFAVLPFDGSVALAELTGEELASFGKALHVKAKSVGVISSGWTIRVLEEEKFPRFRGFVDDKGRLLYLPGEPGDPGVKPEDLGRKYKILTDAFNTLPREGVEGENVYLGQAFNRARKEGRITIFSVQMRDLLVHRFERAKADPKGAALPASCLTGPDLGTPLRVQKVKGP